MLTIEQLNYIESQIKNKERRRIYNEIKDYASSAIPEELLVRIIFQSPIPLREQEE